MAVRPPEIYGAFCNFGKFLLDFNARKMYFYNSNFSLKRVLHFIYKQNSDLLKELQHLKVGKIKRKKIRVTRDNILENAIIIFEQFGKSKSLLEFEYINEEGTGRGPTLEYYSLVIDEFINLKEIIWRNTDDLTLFP